MKRGVPCVTGRLPENAKGIVKKVCRESKSKYLDSTLIDLISIYVQSEGYEIYFMGEEMFLSLNGKYQVRNLKTALAVLFYLIVENIADAGFLEIKKGLQNLERNTGYSYRFRKVADNPQIVLDVSHNAEGLSQLGRKFKTIETQETDYHIRNDV